MPRAVLILLLTALAALAAGCTTRTGTGEERDRAPGAGDAPPVLGGAEEAEEAGTALGFPVFATKNTTRVGGADPVANAAAVALAVYPGLTRATRPQAVVLVDVEDWQSAISAGQLMSRPLRAPILFTRDGELPEASREALDALRPTGAEAAGDAKVIRIGSATAVALDMPTTDVPGTDPAELAGAIDRLQSAAAERTTVTMLVASADQPAFAMPAAGYAAKAGVPVFWTGRDELPGATRAAIRRHRDAQIYVLGPDDAVSERVFDALERLGDVKRVAGRDAVSNAIAFARYAEGSFGWNVVDPGHGLVFAAAERTADAAAAAPLSASGTYGPLLLVRDAGQLPEPVQNYLLDIQPGFDRDPVRGVYNRGWLIGDQDAISVAVQSRIDALLEIQPVDPSK